MREKQETYTITEIAPEKFVVKMRLPGHGGRDKRVYVCQKRSREDAEREIRLLEGAGFEEE